MNRRSVPVELIGGPNDGDLIMADVDPTGVPAHHLIGYRQATPALDIRGRDVRGRWHAWWGYTARADRRPQPYCDGTWTDDLGNRQPCGRGCPARRRSAR